jgi:hypothetical protein
MISKCRRQIRNMSLNMDENKFYIKIVLLKNCPFSEMSMKQNDVHVPIDCLLSNL